MQSEQLLAWVEREYGVQPDHPWQESESCVLRHAQSGKWFALLMLVRRDRLGLPGEGAVPVVNLKCEPQRIGSLRGQPGIHPAYHMNKDHWLTVRLDGSVEDAMLYELAAISYRLTAPKSARRNAKHTAVPLPEDWQW